MLLPNKNSFKNLTSTVRDELKVGFPMGLQNSVISIGMMVLQYFVNQFGSYAVAAYTIGNRVQLLIQNPMNSMSTVIATFAGQNEGAGRYDRIKKGVNFCLLICIVYSIVIGAVSMIFAQPIDGNYAQAEAHSRLLIIPFSLSSGTARLSGRLQCCLYTVEQFRDLKTALCL